MEKRVISIIILFSLTAVLTYYSLLETWMEAENLESAGVKEEIKEVFQINTKWDWISFCERVNKGERSLDAILCQDIDLKNEKCQVLYYEGSFDGKDNCIIDTASSLFYTLGKKGKIQNLHVKDTYITPKQQKGNLGGIVSRNKGSIIGCSVTGYLEGVYFVGGIAGFNEGEILDCINFSTIVSKATGKYHLWWKDYTEELYGAGGIAGFTGCPIMMELSNGNSAFIKNCINYGKITGKVLAGGICGHLAGYGRRYHYEPITYDISYCKNYGSVLCETRYDEVRFGNAGGICGYDLAGTFYRCMNGAKVEFKEDTINRSKYGQAYDISPRAITYSDFAWDSNSRIMDCIAMRGTVSESMRKEFIMEVSVKEYKLWQEGKLDYIVNSWNFNLSQAVEKEELQPLGIMKIEEEKKRENYYLCDKFLITLPEGFRITEEKLYGELYGLRITYEGSDDFHRSEEREEIWKNYETWILRKDIDVQRVLSETYSNAEYYNEISGELMLSSIFKEQLLGYVPDSFIPRIHSWEEKKMEESTYDYHRIFFQKSLKTDDRENQEWEEYGNILSLPLDISAQNEVEAAFFLLHTDKEACFYPPEDYVDAVNGSFYFLEKEDFVAIKERDTIYSLLQKYMEGNMELFRQLNSIENPNLIFPGQQFVFPNPKKWRERPKNIDSNLLSEGCLRAKDTGRESVTVYLEPKEISLKDLEESFPARENCQILAKALQEDRIEEVLKELHQPPRNILSEQEKYLWETRDTVTWYLKDFRRDKEGSSLQEEVWYYFKEEERAYEQITIATVDKKTGFPLYHIMNMLKRPDGNYYVSEPWKAFSFDKGHYFIPSQGRYGQSDLWVPVKDFYGNIKGVAGYFDSDNVIIYMEKIDDTREESSIRIFRQYITRRYLLKEEQKLPYFMERELN